MLIAGFFLSIILTRILGASSFGLYSITLTIYTITAILGGIGIPIAIVKYVAEYKNYLSQLNGIISTCIFNAFLFGTAMGIVLFFLSSGIATFLSMPELTNLIRVIAFSIPFLVCNNVFLGIFNGLRKMRMYTLRTVIRSCILLISTILLILLGLGVYGAVLAIFISEIGTSIFLFGLSASLFRWNFEQYRRITSDLIRFSSMLFLSDASYVIKSRIDILLIGYFLTSSAVGIYALATLIGNMFMMLPNTVSIITFPMMAERWKNGLNDENDRFIGKMMRYSLASMSCIGLLAIFFADTYIPLLFGQEFAPAEIPLTILLFSMIFVSSVASTGVSFVAFGRPDISFKINLVLIVPYLSLAIVLIPLLGINGAALCMAIEMFSSLILVLYLRKKILHLTIDVPFFCLMVLLISCFLLVFVLLRSIVNTYLLAGALMALYVTILFWFIFNREERLEISSQVKHLLSTFNLFRDG